MGSGDGAGTKRTKRNCGAAVLQLKWWRSSMVFHNKPTNSTDTQRSPFSHHYSDNSSIAIFMLSLTYAHLSTKPFTPHIAYAMPSKRKDILPKASLANAGDMLQASAGAGAACCWDAVKEL